MGLIEEQTLMHARQIVLHNAEVINYLKNSIKLISEKTLKSMQIENEKMKVLMKNHYPKVNIKTIVANIDNRDNHDITKFDVELIQQTLIEALEEQKK